MQGPKSKEYKSLNGSNLVIIHVKGESEVRGKWMARYQGKIKL